MIRTRLEQANKLEAMEGVLVQPMLSGEVDVMIGMTRDPLSSVPDRVRPR